MSLMREEDMKRPKSDYRLAIGAGKEGFDSIEEAEGGTDRTGDEEPALGSACSLHCIVYPIRLYRHLNDRCSMLSSRS